MNVNVNKDLLVNSSQKDWSELYDTIRYIYVHSKADDMARLVYRTAQKRNNKEKLKTKSELLRRNGPGGNTDS